MLAGSQDRVALAGAVRAWARLAKEARQKRQHAQKMMAMLIGGQMQLMMADFFAAWSQASEEAKR